MVTHDDDDDDEPILQPAPASPPDRCVCCELGIARVPDSFWTTAVTRYAEAIQCAELRVLSEDSIELRIRDGRSNEAMAIRLPIVAALDVAAGLRIGARALEAGRKPEARGSRWSPHFAPLNRAPADETPIRPPGVPRGRTAP